MRDARHLAAAIALGSMGSRGRYVVARGEDPNGAAERIRLAEIKRARKAAKLARIKEHGGIK